MRDHACEMTLIARELYVRFYTPMYLLNVTSVRRRWCTMGFMCFRLNVLMEHNRILETFCRKVKIPIPGRALNFGLFKLST